MVVIIEDGFIGRVSHVLDSAGGFESFHSSMNPEELFRKIFGDAGFNTSGFGGGFQDFAESAFGFAPAAEVSLSSYYSSITFCPVCQSYCRHLLLHSRNFPKTFSKDIPVSGDF